MFIVDRSPHNPILGPFKNHPWEAWAVFNGSAVKLKKKTIMIYRGMSEEEYYEKNQIRFSTIGRAESTDGVHFDKRSQIIVPEFDWERYGCEDPRVVSFEGSYYIFYTALGNYPFSAQGIKVAVAISEDLKKIKEKHLVTPFNAKAMTLFPERVNGKIAVLFSAHTDIPPAKISLAYINSIEDLWSPYFWNAWHESMSDHELNLKRSDRDHTEIGAPPILIKEGWLLIYSHIQNYGTHETVFGVEAVVLEKDNPKKIIKRTRFPFLVSEEVYEKDGHVPNIVFPTGALIDKKKLTLYYGASDTSIAACSLDLQNLIESMEPGAKKHVTRSKTNPILAPIESNAWESKAVFNPGAIMLQNKIHLIYRAMGRENTSVFGYAEVAEDHKIIERLKEPVYVPREEFELKRGDPNGNSGCEDPRLSLVADRIYMCYTAYNGVNPPRVAITSINAMDFIAKKWDWARPALISPREVDDKDACILEEKIRDQYIMFHRIGPNVCVDHVPSIDFEKERLDRSIIVLSPRKGMWDAQKVGIAAPPLKTQHGWLLFYHGVSNEGIYRIGAALLDLEHPTNMLARTADPLFEPETTYECEGQVSNVVFPCGAIIKKGTIYLYYGGADSVVGAATTKLTPILKALT